MANRTPIWAPSMQAALTQLVESARSFACGAAHLPASAMAREISEAEVSRGAQAACLIKSPMVVPSNIQAPSDDGPCSKNAPTRASTAVRKNRRHRQRPRDRRNRRLASTIRKPPIEHAAGPARVPHHVLATVRTGEGWPRKVTTWALPRLIHVIR